MTKCPWCGSSAQLKVMKTDFEEDGWTIEVTHTYRCGCGQWFTGKSWHHCQECYEVIDILPNQDGNKAYAAAR